MMDSFAHRMSDNDDRRKPIGISDIYDLIALDAEKGGDLSLHANYEIALTVSTQFLNSFFPLHERYESSSLTRFTRSGEVIPIE